MRRFSSSIVMVLAQIGFVVVCVREAAIVNAADCNQNGIEDACDLDCNTPGCNVSGLSPGGLKPATSGRVKTGQF